MNELNHVDEFRKVLANYKLSSSAKQTLQKTRLVLMVGPTSSGRNTIINELLKTGRYHYIVSDTTRQPRVKGGVRIEKDGREYWFRKEDELLADLERGEFLEAAIIHNQQVSGISIREIQSAQQAGQIATTDIEPTGATTIQKLKPDVVIIFILPPGFTTWMQRFRGRSDLPDDEIRRRLAAAYNEILGALEDDHYKFVVNDNFKHAAQKISQIAEENILDPADQVRAKKLARRLLIDIQKHLVTLSTN